MIKTILLKDLKLYFSDRKGILLTFLLPIILITLFAFSFGGVGRKKRVPKPTTLLVVDKDSSQASINFIHKVHSLPMMNLKQMTEEKALDKVKKGKNVGVLLFNKGFQEAVMNGSPIPVELQFDAAREIQTRMLLSVVQESMQRAFGKTQVNSNLQVKTTPVIKLTDNKPNPGLVQAVSGTAIMMLLFSIAAIGGSLLDEKEAGTLKRLLSSPIKPLHILFGKMSTAMIISVLQLAGMFVFAWLAFGLPIFMDTLTLALLILCISFAVSSFGIFLVSVVKTRQQLQGMSSIIIILMSAIGGSMIPIYMMPDFIKKVAVFSVNYWGIEGFFDIFWRQLTVVDILPKMGILIGMGLLMTLLSVPLFKRNIISLD